ncbi:AMP-binding protein [Sneathiella sp. P13V-1]|uniref:class I adenylate-forming enzyme family protein n=1 Tax=Sneathiella sp. P13V-1 TaxID=2697366 RepID=UPI00187B79E8|nr:fatty acid--CoA ligase family protein [Sneathiella sp. P13V-1]MBE7637906.1 AMP-binding protein [Sneathiella sp. P13V-1]
MLFNSFLNIGRIATTEDGKFIKATELLNRIQDRKGQFEKVMKAGDIVMICHGGSAEFVVDLLASWSLGAAAACVNPAATENEINNLVDFIEPSLLIRDSENTPEILKESNVAYPASFNLDNPALYLFTSGTTGTPKGVEHSFRSLLARFTLNQTYIGKENFERTLCALPTHFGHGLIGNLLTPLLVGGDVVLLSDKSPMGLSKLGQIIDDFDINFLSSVPSFWKMALRLSKPPQKGTLKRLHVGSAPLSLELWQEIATWAGTDNVYNMYGITETANWIGGTSLQEGADADGLIGSVWGGSALVKNTENGEISKSGTGELLIQSPSLMNGYFKQPELTADVLKEGWFHTGDIGQIEEDGSIRITGRQKSEINKAGMKILPEEIDLLLEKHENIQEVCTFGLPDPISGERVAAAVVTDGSELNGATLSKWMTPLIRKDAIPEKWFFVTEIPKTDRGKINRDNVRNVCLEQDTSK